MQTIDLVSAIISVAVVGTLALRFGLMANTMLIAEVLWDRRIAADQGAPSAPARPLSAPPAR